MNVFELAPTKSARQTSEATNANIDIENSLNIDFSITWARRNETETNSSNCNLILTKRVLSFFWPLKFKRPTFKFKRPPSDA